MSTEARTIRKAVSGARGLEEQTGETPTERQMPTPAGRRCHTRTPTPDPRTPVLMFGQGPTLRLVTEQDLHPAAGDRSVQMLAMVMMAVYGFVLGCLCGGSVTALLF